jgi:ribosome biogenesis GTPase
MKNAMVVAVHRGQVDVLVDGEKDWTLCSVRGHLRELIKDEKRETVTKLAVGDRVKIDVLRKGIGVVEEIEERRSELSRPSTSRKHLKQVLCANVDQVCIMVSIRQPRFKSQVIDRLVVISLWGNVSPIILVTKMDLAEAAEFAKIRQMYAGFDLPILALSVEDKRGVEEVRQLTVDKITAFCGQSGVGKSTLLNELLGEELAPTQEVNRKTSKGKHTTTWTEIFPLPGGGQVVDLPGNQQFGLWEIPEDMISHFLPDFETWGRECHFQPCSHIHEPKCRVKEALEAGDLNPDRYRNYVRIYESVGGN